MLGIGAALGLLLASTMGSTVEQHQYCVIGAGPAGLQLGHYLHTAGRDYVILEAQPTVGSFFKCTSLAVLVSLTWWPPAGASLSTGS